LELQGSSAPCSKKNFKAVFFRLETKGHLIFFTLIFNLQLSCHTQTLLTEIYRRGQSNEDLKMEYKTTLSVKKAMLASLMVGSSAM
jgi:hypothetical protein